MGRPTRLDGMFRDAAMFALMLVLLGLLFVLCSG